MNKKLALFGNGGHAREVMAQMQQSLIRFVDDIFFKGEGGTLPISSFNIEEYKIMVAVGDSAARSRVTELLPQGTEFFSFIHPTALIMDGAIEIGEGCFIGAYSILTTNIKIGSHAILNRSNHIGHDCLIGDFFSAMPGSIVSGNCNIGNRVYLGTNASVREKIFICDDVIVGINSGIVKNISEPGIYGGLPAKKIK